jgi:hypothetical protein
MIKSIITAIVLTCSIRGLGQPHNVKLKIEQNGCDVNFEFSNKGTERILIPNLTSRCLKEDRYFVLSSKYIKINQDTLKITLNSRNDVDSNNFRISPKPSKVTITYSEKVLKKINTQHVRLPEEYCRHKFRYCTIFFNNQLLAENNVDQK